MATHAHTDHHRGDMDIHEQAHTYRMFGRLTKWLSLVTAVTLLFLTLWFATPAGFVGALVTAVVVLAVGITVLRERRHAVH